MKNPLSFLRPGGSDGGGKQSATPIPDRIIEEASAHADQLQNDDRGLRELLDEVQRYIWSMEYQNRHGNAFYERLIEDFNDDRNLRQPILFRDNEMFLIILADGWAEITEELGFNGREARAVRDAHQLYANDADLAAYSSQVCVMAIHVRRDDRLREIANLVDIDSERVRLAGA